MMPLSVDDAYGRNMKWNLYAVDFDSPDGKYSFNIYAISDEHAQMQVDAIKETASLAGQIAQRIQGD